jgi:hypothetical protein
MNLKNDSALELNINNISNSFLYDNTNLFYIDNHKSLPGFKITHINYKKYKTTTYDEKEEFLKIFHTLYKKAYNHLLYKPKLIIIIDVALLKKHIELSSDSVYSIKLINLIRHISDNYNEYIESCLIINCNNIEKGVISLFKLLLKNIDFIHKLTVYEKKL